MKTILIVLVSTLGLCTTLSAQVYQNQVPVQRPTYQQPIQQQVYQQPVYGTPQVQYPNQIPQGQGVIQASNTVVVQPHWTQSLVGDTGEHDFGAVAKASKQEHTFEFTNTLDTPLHLIGVRASCGCTKPTIVTSTVNPGEVGKLHAKFDTMKFDGARGATLSVSVRKDAPYTEYGEIQFSVKGQIRRDVVLNPGAVEFTDVLSGNPAQRTLTLAFAGDPNWQVREVITSNPNVTVDFRETRRDPNARRVDYELVVQMNGEQKEGQFSDNLTIVTNDRANAQITVDVNGKVLSVIQTTDIQLGVLNQNQKIEKSMIIRGVRPFRIEEIRVNNPAIEILEHDGEKTLHIVKYTLDTSKAQKIDDEFTVVTTDPLQKEAKIGFNAQVVAGTFTGGDK